MSLSTPSTSTPNPTIPPSITSFQFLKPISSGAFGQVYLARKPPTQTIYAIKVLLKKDLIRKNMTSQVVQERTALLSSKSNDFCVKLFYSLQSHDHVYFVMEYCSGGDLKSLVNHMRFFSIPMAGFYVAEVATALHYIHSRGIIHRDIKPDNMLIDARGHVKLIDFGLSDVGVKNKLVGSPLVGYTPGMVASLGQNLTFGSCSSPSNSSTSPADFQSCSGHLSNLSSPGVHELQGSQPNHHSTPVGSLGTAGNPNHQNPVVMHTKHRKVRIPLRKLGSRSHLNTSSNSSISIPDQSSLSSDSSSSSSSSWCIINTPPPQQPQEISEPDPQINVKRVKLTPKIGFNFEDSSFLSLSFNFAQQANNQPQITPPNTLPTRLPLNTSSPIPLILEDATTPTSTGFSAFSSNMFTPPNLTMSPLITQPQVPQSNENFFTEQASEHDRPSPERGRFRNERSTSTFFSMPLLHPTNNNEKTSHAINSPELHHQSKHSVLQESLVNRPNVFFNPNPKSPTWPLPKLPTPMESSEKPKKRKRHTEGPVQVNRSTGLTADVSAMLIGAQQHTPLTHNSVHCNTPQNGGVRLLGTPDYLAPELIKLAMSENDSRNEETCVGVTVACDWWSLGVCFYEFVIGVLPFNDDTPDMIFNNILDRELEYPEGIDERLVNVLDGLICSDPGRRFRFDQLMREEYLVLFGLREVGDWGRLREMEVPWVPGGGE